MSKIDAEMFSDACSFVFLALEGDRRGFIPYEKTYQKNFDAIQYNKLLHLQDCGLLIIGQTVYSIDPNTMLEYQDLLLEVKKNVKFEVQFRVITLTKVGTELYRIVQPKLCMDHLRGFAKWIESENCQLFSTQIINRYPDGRIKKYQKNFTPIESNQPDGAAPHIQK